MSAKSSKEDSEDDEIDFMSDVFVDESKNNSRPGLVFSRKTQRIHELEKKKASNKPRSFKTMEAERRNEALEKPLNESNKGFKLLQKMGFKPEKDGDKMGKVIPIVCKADTIGLGMTSHIKERIEQQLNAKRKANEIIAGDFQKRMRSKFTDKKMESDLISSQKACYRLDSEAGITETSHPWFWPKAITETKVESDEKEDSNDETESIPVEEKLLILTVYLRTKYFYCIWCGVKYASEDELETECPGNTSDDHD